MGTRHVARTRSPRLTAWLLGVATIAPAFATDAPATASGHAPSPAPADRTRPAPLDLRIGDIRRYVPAEILDTPIEEDFEEIIVNGQRPEPLPERRAVPQGLGALIYGVTNPLQAWRILAPDPNVVIPERSEDDVREPPGAYRGRILAPGQIFD